MSVAEAWSALLNLTPCYTPLPPPLAPSVLNLPSQNCTNQGNFTLYGLVRRSCETTPQVLNLTLSASDKVKFRHTGSMWVYFLGLLMFDPCFYSPFVLAGLFLYKMEEFKSGLQGLLCKTLLPQTERNRRGVLVTSVKLAFKRLPSNLVWKQVNTGSSQKRKRLALV